MLDENGTDDFGSTTTTPRITYIHLSEDTIANACLWGCVSSSWLIALLAFCVYVVIRLLR